MKMKVINKYKYIILLYIISFGSWLYIHDFNIKLTMGSTIFQLIGSYIIGYSGSFFANKYYRSSLLEWWTSVYIVFVGFAILSEILFPLLF